MWPLSVLLLTVATVTSAKPVHVTLEAPWYPVSESILALETVSNYNSSAFFPMLSLLINERMKPDGATDEVDYILTTAEHAGFLKQSSSLAARQELALGAVIPRVESQYQMFESVLNELDPKYKSNECGIVMWTEGKYTCDRTDLFALQAPANPITPELRLDDRVIGNGEQWLVVYADLDSPEFPEWHEMLLEMALTGRVSYVLRHRPSLGVDANGKHINLAGYGMSFDLKRTDYLVIDDRLSNGEDVKLDLNATNKIPAGKVSDLGFALSRKVRHSNATELERFEALKDLMFNLPAHISELAAEIDNSTAEAERHENKIGAPGFNAAFLDGVLLKDHDLFNFYAELHKELDLIHQLELLTPEGVNIPDFLTSGIVHDGDDEGTTRKQRYNLMKSGSAIGWITDIEQDVLYEGMSDELDLLLATSSPFVPVRRNIHTVVVAGDLNDRRTLAALYAVTKQAGQQLPLQIGLVSSSKEWLNIAKLGRDARQAFISRVLQGAPPLEAAKYAQEVYEDISSDPETPKNSASAHPLTDPQEFYERFGVDVSTGPVLFANGFPLPTENWMNMASVVFQTDSDYLRGLENIGSLPSLRDTLFATGESRRNRILDPVSTEYVPWPLNSPMHVFKNPQNNSSSDEESAVVRHSVVFSSAFSDIESFRIAESLLQRAHEKNDLELVIRPLNGIYPKFYASLFDPTYNMFRFSLDLLSAARGHLFEHKTEPRVFNVSKTPDIRPETLPVEKESLIIDGRYIDLSSGDLTVEMLPELVERETNRVIRIQSHVPGIDGLGIAALSSAAPDRTVITNEDLPDILLDSKNSNITVTLLVDPATTEGQKYMALGMTAKSAGLKVKLFMSPSELTEVPKKFYQPAINRSSPVIFTSLSDDVLYSAELVEPESWLTVALDSEYDLDNVVLNMVKEDKLCAIYSLRSLLIQGFAQGPKAAGSVLDLRASNDTKLSDTSVMANLGYFQFQAPIPGLYEVCIVGKDKSFVSQAGTTDCLPAAITNYNGAILKTAFKAEAPKHPRHSASKRSLWAPFKRLAGKSVDKTQAKNAEVNIFTVASGHLYERFASIMMLSVMKNTKHTVKFWLIENFMSPKFKKFVPELAQKYSFDYEFVSYKWPSWLRKQTEKQRQIWGYKILFLDTLFPQSLSNVIFVDSDQIVRTDFKELIDMDLGGAPYAFAPMGDDREEMEPFRFWKKGFWRESLLDKGFHYHISALYRVDLDTFRKSHIGDILRQHYQRLSANPDNLANLDQDLPNSLQSVVPIRTLPRQWLWCETWCSDESLKEAKTIDLCNNPLTKEPKLDRARRQIPEWVEYDTLVSQLAETVEQERLANLAAQVDFERPSEYADHPNDHDFSRDEEFIEPDHSEL